MPSVSYVKQVDAWDKAHPVDRTPPAVKEAPAVPETSKQKPVWMTENDPWQLNTGCRRNAESATLRKKALLQEKKYYILTSKIYIPRY